MSDPAGGAVVVTLVAVAAVSMLAGFGLGMLTAGFLL